MHLNSSKMGGIGAFIGRITGVKRIIFTAHGFAFNEDRPMWQKLILIFFHYLTILLTHKTIMVSDKTKKDIDYLPFIKNKLVKIYNGIDTNIDFYDKSIALKDLVKNQINTENKTILLSIGELHKNKGYDLFIPHLKDLNKYFVYLIIGNGEEKENLEKIIKENNLQDKVYLLGRIEEAYRYVKASDVFLLPSRTEAFPYVLLESGLGQSTIMASKVGGISEIIIDNETGILFDINNRAEVLDKLNNLIGNRDLREKLALSVHDKVKADFSLDKMIKKTLEIYK